MNEKPVNELPLRERKKEIARQAIIASAERLFEEKGFDAVTVAEIADAANVSKKTLFTYFRSKEELIFQDSGMIDAVVGALVSRATSTRPVDTVVATLVALIRDGGDPIESLGAYHRAYGDSDVLQSRLLRLWDEYELRIADALAAGENRGRSDLDVRFEAAQLVMLMRALTWPQALEFAEAAQGEAFRDIEAWLVAKARSIG